MEADTYFDRVAPAWEEMRSRFFSDGLRDAALAAAGVCPGETAADIGAGSGFITEGLLSKGLRVCAVDRSQAMLEEMRKRFGAGAAVTYCIGDAEDLPLADGCVDYVFANMCLHHVPHPALAVMEMARILKPGGRLVITDLDLHGFAFLQEEHHDIWPGFDRGQIRQWLSDAGLAGIGVDCAGHNCCAQSQDGRAAAEVSIFLAYGEKPRRGSD